MLRPASIPADAEQSTRLGGSIVRNWHLGTGGSYRKWGHFVKRLEVGHDRRLKTRADRPNAAMAWLPGCPGICRAARLEDDPVGRAPTGSAHGRHRWSGQRHASWLEAFNADAMLRRGKAGELGRQRGRHPRSADAALHTKQTSRGEGSGEGRLNGGCSLGLTFADVMC